MDRAFGRNPDIAGKTPEEELADLACAPVRLLSLQPDNQSLDRLRQLVGVAHRPARPIAQGHQPVLLVTVENLVAGLTRYAEIPADVRHRLAIQQAGYKAKALFHHRTRFPRHPHLPPAKGEKCYPCVRYGMSPMSRAAQHPQPKIRRSVGWAKARDPVLMRGQSLARIAREDGRERPDVAHA